MRPQTLRRWLALPNRDELSTREAAEILGVTPRQLTLSISAWRRRQRGSSLWSPRTLTAPGASELSPDDQALWDDWNEIKGWAPGISVKKAAARLGVADKTLYRLASRVKLSRGVIQA